MAILNKKLHAKNNKAEEDFELSTTKEELGTTANFIEGNVDGTTIYIGLDTDMSVSSLHVNKNNTSYSVKRENAPKVVPGKQEYLTPGTYTFTAPYTTEYTVEVAGGGGGGGSSTPRTYAGNGGQGALVTQTLALVKDKVYSVVVGAGGAGGAAPGTDNNGDAVGYTGGTGGTSKFGTISAQGGTGGTGGASGFSSPQIGWEVIRNGSSGASYGKGGVGGTGGNTTSGGTNYVGSAGSPGWVKIIWK